MLAPASPAGGRRRSEAQRANANQLRGWKDIAAFLGTSVRTAVRWEAERGVPVRRQPGGARDVIYALRDELQSWQRSNPVRAGTDPREPSEPAAGSQNDKVGAAPEPRRIQSSEILPGERGGGLDPGRF